MGRARWAQHEPIANPGVASPFAVRTLTRFVLPVARALFGATLDGTEHLPEAQPFLLVANHPPSVGGAEFLSFAALWAAQFGATRPLAGFALAATFDWWPLSKVFPHVGAIPSTYGAAEETLARGVPIVLFPGGDHEGFRPFWQAGRVDFGGRVGFLRIARKAWVPVVPMAIRGGTAPVLIRSRALAYLAVWPRLTGVKRYGVTVLGAIGAAVILAFVPLSWPWRALLAWAWVASPLALLSWWPSRIRIRIGAPIAPEVLFGRREGDDAALVPALAVVEAAVQALVRAKE